MIRNNRNVHPSPPLTNHKLLSSPFIAWPPPKINSQGSSVTFSRSKDWGADSWAAHLLRALHSDAACERAGKPAWGRKEARQNVGLVVLLQPDPRGGSGVRMVVLLWGNGAGLFYGCINQSSAVSPPRRGWCRTSQASLSCATQLVTGKSLEPRRVQQLWAVSSQFIQQLGDGRLRKGIWAGEHILILVIAQSQGGRRGIATVHDNTKQETSFVYDKASFTVLYVLWWHERHRPDTKNQEQL